MNREIKKYPDPVLRNKTEEVGEITPEIKTLIEDIKETMKKEDGAGLAAPQIGVLKRVIVVDVGKGPLAFINPKIIGTSKRTQTIEEGCLSFPGLFLKIKRPKEVEIEAENEKGEKIRLKAEGMFACVFQHEVDHLDGILFIDRIGFWQKLRIQNKLNKYGVNS